VIDLYVETVYSSEGRRFNMSVRAPTSKVEAPPPTTRLEQVLAAGLRALTPEKKSDSTGHCALAHSDDDEADTGMYKCEMVCCDEGADGADGGAAN